MSECLLRMEHISKAFPGVQALQDVHFDLCPGEVHALVGENGAGKSTLIKILAGVHHPDTGQIWLRDRLCTPRSPRHMLERGVHVIYQELNLVPGLSVAENIFLGREPLRGPLRSLIDWPAIYDRTREILRPWGLPLEPRAKVGTLGVAQQQLIEIAKAVSFDPAVVVMDEPTASLTQREVDRLFAIIRTLQQRGVAVVYVSHRLDEIQRIADRVTVLRDGQCVVTARLAELSTDQMIRHMVGRSVQEQYPKQPLSLGDVVLQVEGLARRGTCDDVSFALRAGELLGIAGLAGAGRSEMMELLFGRRKMERGTIRIQGRAVRVRSPRDAVQHGIGLIPEERKTQGLVLELSLLDNAAFSILSRQSTAGLIRWARVRTQVEQVVRDLRIKAASLAQRVKHLSGGNQQKTVLAKWLLRKCRVYIFDEPTRGVDVGAKREIYRLMDELARQGAGIIMISSDLNEVLNLSDRILVVREGRIVKELGRDEATPEKVLRWAIGGDTRVSK